MKSLKVVYVTADLDDVMESWAQFYNADYDTYYLDPVKKIAVFKLYLEEGDELPKVPNEA